MVDVTALRERIEIIAVCTRLHWLVDHRQWSELHTVLAEFLSFPTLAEQADEDFHAEDFVRHRDDIQSAYPALLAGLSTMHLLVGHHVIVDGDGALCRAHSINLHHPDVAPRSDDQLDTADDVVSHGNEYEFALRRTDNGWRIVGRRTWTRWSRGPTAMHDVTAKQERWAQSVRTQPAPDST